MADAVLCLHFAFVVFVVGGLAAIIAGGRARARWALNRGVRAAHLAATLFVAVQAWMGRDCPLTSVESRLRVRTGEPPYATTFVRHWLDRLLYYDAPAAVFTAAYTAFAALTVAVNIVIERRRTDGRPFRGSPAGRSSARRSRVGPTAPWPSANPGPSPRHG